MINIILASILLSNINGDLWVKPGAATPTRKLDKLVALSQNILHVRKHLICRVTWVLPECACQISPSLPGVISWKKKNDAKVGPLELLTNKPRRKSKVSFFSTSAPILKKQFPLKRKKYWHLGRCRYVPASTWFIENVCA